MKRKDFAEQIGCKLWPKYEEIFDSIDSGSKRIMIRSCNAAGKTYLLSILAAYELSVAKDWEGDVAPPSLNVIVTGASQTQVHNSLWAEIKRQVKAAKIPQKKSKELKISKNESQWIIPINPGKIESGQGYHADRVVIFIDEATGFTQAMIDALLSNAAGDDILIIFTFNPLDSDSAMFAMEERESDWQKFEISAFDHPNVLTGENLIPGAITQERVTSWCRMWSVECDCTTPEAVHTPWNNKYYQPTPEILARVCGKWSIAASHGFIPMSEILMCCRSEQLLVPGERWIGVDVAARGDDRTVVCLFSGNELLEYFELQSGEYHHVARFIENICINHHVYGICIDDTGIGNAVTVRLKQSVIINCKIIAINFAQAAKGFEKFRDSKPHNARAEMYMCLETEVRRLEIKLLYIPDALKEIAAARIVPAKGSTTVRLEDKSLIKRRIGRSPDYADATALARYGPKVYNSLNHSWMF